MPVVPEPKPLEELTREDFQAYERVRAGGRYNMYDPRARQLTGLDRETFVGVLKHYAKLMELYPDVRGNDDGG